MKYVPAKYSLYTDQPTVIIDFYIFMT